MLRKVICWRRHLCGGWGAKCIQVALIRQSGRKSFEGFSTEPQPELKSGNFAVCHLQKLLKIFLQFPEQFSTRLESANTNNNFFSFLKVLFNLKFNWGIRGDAMHNLFSEFHQFEETWCKRYQTIFLWKHRKNVKCCPCYSLFNGPQECWNCCINCQKCKKMNIFFSSNLLKTSQELRMLSSVTLNCQVTKIVMNSDCHFSEL